MPCFLHDHTYFSPLQIRWATLSTWVLDGLPRQVSRHPRIVLAFSKLIRSVCKKLFKTEFVQSLKQSLNVAI